MRARFPRSPAPSLKDDPVYLQAISFVLNPEAQIVTPVKPFGFGSLPQIFTKN